MVKYSLNTKDSAVRNMLIEKYNELGVRAFEREWEISGRVVREWKKLQF
jgi:predicted DNA-binding transcriptional regulator